MNKTPRPPFLRLVSSKNDALRSDVRNAANSTQDTFLPSSSSNTITFINWRRTTTEDIIDVFELSRPKLIFDLRIAPRFDLHGMTRRWFFDGLREYNCQYVDLLGRLGIKSIADALTNPALIALHSSKFLEGLKPPNSGPLVFFHDDDVLTDEHLANIARALPNPSGGGWQVYTPLGDKKPSGSRIERVSSPNVTPLVRSTIFISHATPEDNGFVVWLSSRLIAAGYEVWTDISQLKGGDVFWKDIEDVIRTRAVKVIFIQSAFVGKKPGARKEAYLALKVGDRNGIKRFVVPMRIDSTPFEDTLIELIDLQSIDCRSNWIHGLESLLTVLERDRVPRTDTFKAIQFAELVKRAHRPPVAVSQDVEQLISNCLPIKTVPKSINFYECSGLQTNELRDIAGQLATPSFAYYALLATTVGRDKLLGELEELGFNANVKLRSSIPWDDYLSAKCGDLPVWKRGEARNQVFKLMNQHWDTYFLRAGALPGSLANGRRFWYFADQHFQNNKVRFADHSSRIIQRQLVGFSAKRRVYWHFGVRGRAMLQNDQMQFVVSPHVTFSSDGRTPLASVAQQHSLRRSFCKSWWNDRWRDLLQGSIAAVATEDNLLMFDKTSDSPIAVSSRFESMPLTAAPTFDDGDTKTTTISDEEVEDVWDDDVYSEDMDELHDADES